MKKKIELTVTNITSILILLVVTFYLLYIGKSLLIPLVIAFLLSLAIISLYNFFLKHKFPKILAIVLSILFYVLIFYFFGKLIETNINEIVKLTPTYQTELKELLVQVTTFLKIPDLNMLDLFNNIDLQKILTSLISSITSVLSSAGLIVLYIIFILYEYKYFRIKVSKIASKYFNNYNLVHTLDQIRSDIKGYFLVKTWVSLLSAGGSYLIMLVFGLDFAAFWAVLIFVMNYIPNIGSLIALALPSILSFIQPEFAIFESVIMIILLIGYDQLTGNIIETKFLGSKLNLSPIVVLLALAFWGEIWGVVGMFLSAPIMVITNIILARFSTTRPIAIFLSEKGEINNIIPPEKKIEES